MSKDYLKIGKVGININGDPLLAINHISKVIEICENSNIEIIWVGENPLFVDPFKVAEIIAKKTNLKIGFGVITARNDPNETLKKAKKLIAEYGDRFIFGLGSGGLSIDKFKLLIKSFKSLDSPIFGGVTWERSFKLVSELCDGILLNHVNPEHVKYFAEKVDSIFLIAYGPTLILPSDFEMDLIIACAIVMRTSPNFLKKFGYFKVYEEIKDIDMNYLIERRRSGKLCEISEFKKLKKYKDFLFEKFSISGSFENVVDRIRSLLNYTKHVVLGDPFFRDLKSVGRIDEITKVVR